MPGTPHAQRESRVRAFPRAAESTRRREAAQGVMCAASLHVATYPRPAGAAEYEVRATWGRPHAAALRFDAEHCGSWTHP